MAKNKLSDLNDHIFAQLERLGDEEMEPEKMEMELKKSKAIAQLSDQVIKNAKLVFDVAKSHAKGDLKAVPEQFQNKQLNP